MAFWQSSFTKIAIFVKLDSQISRGFYKPGGWLRSCRDDTIAHGLNSSAVKAKAKYATVLRFKEVTLGGIRHRISPNDKQKNSQTATFVPSDQVYGHAGNIEIGRAHV